MHCEERFQPSFLNPGLLATLLLALAVVVAGCGTVEAPAPEPEPEPEPAVTEPEPASAVPSVFFVAPAEGATVSSPVKFDFGLENFTLLPVPEAVEQVREGVGHHHLGVDTDCLPVGEVIPQADPWVHFGDGSTTIEMQLAPGEHRFALQIGDDEHRTLDELCSTITITVGE